jgi:hypothetical protein
VLKKIVKLEDVASILVSIFGLAVAAWINKHVIAYGIGAGILLVGLRYAKSSRELRSESLIPAAMAAQGHGDTAIKAAASSPKAELKSATEAKGRPDISSQNRVHVLLIAATLGLIAIVVVFHVLYDAGLFHWIHLRYRADARGTLAVALLLAFIPSRISLTYLRDGLWRGICFTVSLATLLSLIVDLLFWLDGHGVLNFAEPYFRLYRAHPWIMSAALVLVLDIGAFVWCRIDYQRKSQSKSPAWSGADEEWDWSEPAGVVAIAGLLIVGVLAVLALLTSAWFTTSVHHIWFSTIGLLVIAGVCGIVAAATTSESSFRRHKGPAIVSGSIGAPLAIATGIVWILRISDIYYEWYIISGMVLVLGGWFAIITVNEIIIDDSEDWVWLPAITIFFAVIGFVLTGGFQIYNQVIR